MQTASGNNTETLVFLRLTDGYNIGLIYEVLLQRNSGTIQRVEYTYYDEESNEAYGARGDLKTVTVFNSGNESLGTTYYRYYTQSEGGLSNGFEHAIKYAFEPAAFERLTKASGDPFTANETTAAPFSDNYFEFDGQYRVSTMTVSGDGCSVCAGGQGEYTFSYLSSENTPDENHWAMKTTETLPDGNSNVVYTNKFGQIMLTDFHDTTTDQHWISDWLYCRALSSCPNVS